MVISFDINKEDYWKFNKHVIMNNLKYKRRFLTSLILLPVVMSIIFNADAAADMVLLDCWNYPGTRCACLLLQAI